MKVRKAVLACLAGTAMLVTACSGGTNSSPGNGPVQQGGSITVGDAVAIPQLNPAIRTFAAEEVLFPLLWDGLTQTDRSGNIAPDLATSWSSTPDQKTWTFRLRSGVKFNDGTPFTAQDVVDTFEYYLNPSTATQEAAKIGFVDKVKAVGATTVEFDLKSADAVFPAAIVFVKMLKMSTLSTIDKDPVGTGPYKLSEFVPGDHVTLVRNPDYWGKPASLDTIDIVGATNSAAMTNSLLSGGLDVVWGLAASDVSKVNSSASADIVEPSSKSQYEDYEVDTTAAPFNNVEARQALAYSFDRARILQDAYYGQGTVSATNDPIPDHSPAFASGQTNYSYDLNKAKRLFAEAGVNAGATFTWWGLAGQYPEWNTTAQILQASLRQIGINLKIQNVDSATWAAKFYPAGKSFPGLIVPNRQPRPAEPAFSLAYFLAGTCQCNWADPAYESAYDKARSEADPKARNADWGAVQQILNQEVPEIIPLQLAATVGASKKVTGVWEEPGGQLHVESAARVG